MNRHAVLQPSADDATRLRGRPLVAIRTLAFALVTLTLAMYALALPGLTPRLATPCNDLDRCIIAPEQIAPLARLGITPDALAVGVSALSCLAILLVLSVAGVLLWRRSDDWMALLVAVTLILMPAVLTPISNGLPASIQGISHFYGQAAFLALYLLIGLFPSGRFVPRWIWLVIVLDMLLEGIGLPVPTSGSELAQAIVGAFNALLILVTYASLIGGQIYRYRRLSTPAQRQQTKWVVFGVILTFLVNQLDRTSVV